MIKTTPTTLAGLLAAAILPLSADGALIGQWAFDEGAGTTAGDSSPGGANPGTITNATWGSDATRSSYLSFNGTSSVVDPTLTLPVMTTTNDFTWAFWVNNQLQATDTTQRNSIIVGNRAQAGGGDFSPRQFVKFTPTKFEWHAEANGNDNQEYADLAVGEWHHIAVVKTGTSVQLYRDGVASGAAGTLNESLLNAAALPFFIGGQPGQNGNEFFNGYIDDVRIYDNALTAQEVGALVPEPGSLALLGLGGLLIARRRRASV